MSIAQRQHDPMQGEPSLKQRYESVCGRIADAAARAGRRPEAVVLTAVTKYASIDQIRELIELGHTDFAENRVQALTHRVAQIDEFLQRHRQLHSSRHISLPGQLRWHMIGHLQRNKVRKVLDLVRLIHSVDSLRLAEEIQVAAARREEPVEVLVQVNIAGEKTKQGVAPAAAGPLVEQLDTMMSVRPRGLMCMAPLVDDPEEVRAVFERCRELLEDIRSRGLGGPQFDILSMGMSNDFEVAVECGANVVRVGTAIFGNPANPGPDAEPRPDDGDDG
jgi:pyridoxal phosphate enzyme (YggS family)